MLYSVRGCTVRILYAGNAHERLRAPAAQSGSDKGRDPGGDRRKSLPLHGIHPDPELDREGER